MLRYPHLSGMSYEQLSRYALKLIETRKNSWHLILDELVYIREQMQMQLRRDTVVVDDVKLISAF